MNTLRNLLLVAVSGVTMLTLSSCVTAGGKGCGAKQSCCCHGGKEACAHQGGSCCKSCDPCVR